MRKINFKTVLECFASTDGHLGIALRKHKNGGIFGLGNLKTVYFLPVGALRGKLREILQSNSSNGV